MAFLTALSGEMAGQVFELSDSPVSVGRSSASDITINDASVSAQHCTVMPNQGEYAVRDLSSTNGTTLNDSDIVEAPLEDGDVLGVGDIQFLFADENPDDTDEEFPVDAPPAPNSWSQAPVIEFAPRGRTKGAWGGIVLATGGLALLLAVWFLVRLFSI